MHVDHQSAGTSVISGSTLHALCSAARASHDLVHGPPLSQKSTSPVLREPVVVSVGSRRRPTASVTKSGDSSTLANMELQQTPPHDGQGWLDCDHGVKSHSGPGNGRGLDVIKVRVQEAPTLQNACRCRLGTPPRSGL
eukprot:CAMPEP_0181404672 /NCGR_PEP_ID=MMETSP1110-20121109/4369_1 /TAXON_ID=174948 /ORGANISM="Symbiodinium sp., Strain CCMP421" /LENGTH=137 /DNA_ID=CAMNT_0023527045 /DNA_START=201 /DNA_END=615 /DNA_ORIENTATION=+